jgi:hypothetical protein
MQLLVKSVLTQRQNNWGRPDHSQAAADDMHYGGSGNVPDFSQVLPPFFSGGGEITQFNINRS